eukprot:6187583-Pleurochrysis_carterae.AAC.4
MSCSLNALAWPRVPRFLLPSLLRADALARSTNLSHEASNRVSMRRACSPGGSNSSTAPSPIPHAPVGRSFRRHGSASSLFSIAASRLLHVQITASARERHR